MLAFNFFWFKTKLIFYKEHLRCIYFYSALPIEEGPQICWNFVAASDGFEKVIYTLTLFLTILDISAGIFLAKSIHFAVHGS